MMMWRPRLPSPFGTAFLGVPTAVQLILHDLGFAPVQSDGEILVACCLEWVKKDQVANPDAVVFDPRPWTRIVGIAPDGNHVLVASDTYNLILARILGSQPQPLEEADLELATKTLQQLLFRAAGARQSHTYSPLEMEQAIRDREEWILSGSIEVPDVLAVANKWRHWKPGKIQTQLPTSQRALEQHLRARWLERLLGYFIPFRHQIPYMHQVMGAKELEEFGHLFGDARFRTIRAHCLAYEGMRKIGFQNLPWTAGDVRHLMNQAVTLEVTPAKLQKWWGTLKWLSIKLGMLNVDEHKQLLAKRKAIQETLVDTQVKPQRKAVVPTRAIVWALEQGAEGGPSENRVPELTKAVDRYIMAMARFNLACSARFNDVQHTSPQTVRSTSNTLELLAWQTKTTSAVAIKRNPVPLIAPLFSFSGARWWIPLEKWWKRFRASEEFREMDYLIPTINKDRTGFIPRPGTPLRWLKDALGKQGAPAKDVAELSWYSFRVFMPDCAFQAHIPRDQRQYLGNWFKESTADVYTREKRHVVCSIWDQVLQKLPSMQLEAGRAVRVDLGHEDWADKVECPASPKALFKEVPDTPPSHASWDVIPADKPAITKVAADEVPPPRGPLTVIATTARKGPTKAYSMHLLDTDGVTVGCGWRPGPPKISELAKQDFHAEPEMYLGCTRCFRHFTFPNTWMAVEPYAAQDSEASISLSSDTDESVDTQSDKEAIVLPEIE